MNLFFLRNSIKVDVILVTLITALQTILLWPGTMLPDSVGQYQMALSGVYIDHHPPLMSFIWRHLAMIYPGQALMFVLQMALLGWSIFFLMQTLAGNQLRYLYLAFPFIPHVFAHKVYILKDVHFALSFLFVASYCAWTASQKRSLRWPELLFLLPILLYGTSIKFQGQYCAPMLLAWITYLLVNRHFSKKFFLVFILITTTFYSTVQGIDAWLLQGGTKSHSWQLVKLYDLAAISVATQTDLFPRCAKTHFYSWEKLPTLFTAKRVDPLVFPSDAPLKKGKTEEERRIILNTWLNVVIHHPFEYVKHRFSNLSNLATHITGERFLQPFLTRLFSEESTAYRASLTVLRMLGHFFLSPLFVLVLCFTYVLLGLFYWRKSIWQAECLFFFNATGLIMIFALFFFSMAADTRYIYIISCLTHASHLFAFKLYRYK